MSRWPQMPWQLFRYLAVGIGVVVVDYASFLLGILVGLSAVPANALGKVTATTLGYLLHRYYTFAGPQRLGLRKQMVSYFALSAANLALSSVLVHGLVHGLGFSALVAKMLSDIVVISVAYLVSRFVIYAPTRN